MARPGPGEAGNKSSPSRANTYLVVYNFLSASLRAVIFCYSIQLWYRDGYSTVWRELHLVARWAETLAVAEVVHAATGLVHASPSTTALQVAGRNTIVWAITRNYPDIAARDRAYPIMIITWNLADTVRYTYFAVERRIGRVPNILLWLRYNLFIVLYPVGILAEAWLVYQVIEPSRDRNLAYQYLLWFGISIYIPAFYILYGHMLRQRGKSIQKNQKTF
ncbi:hypothetical protein jhhlp_003377 [Lomentospora prolificans]|uniref:Very-long-chain (3R)-3-hydroxyacyl-CoA dehydratase n=1 Tax=Lomentospora prolificans TaxID=41688 RepID=A0A2N3NCB4_9PEZI|nr:hypothetical protein jhhlp_003377 [Lomentospora prolificans]